MAVQPVLVRCAALRHQSSPKEPPQTEGRLDMCTPEQWVLLATPLCLRAPLEKCRSIASMRAASPGSYLRKFEIERLPISIEDEMDKQSFLWQLGTEGDTVRMIAPVRLVEFYSMPALNPLADQLGQGHPLALGAGVSQ